MKKATEAEDFENLMTSMIENEECAIHMNKIILDTLNNLKTYQMIK